MAAVDIKTNLVSVTNMSPRFSAGRIDWPFDICSLISSCFSIGTAGTTIRVTYLNMALRS